MVGCPDGGGSRGAQIAGLALSLGDLFEERWTPPVRTGYIGRGVVRFPFECSSPLRNVEAKNVVLNIAHPPGQSAQLLGEGLALRQEVVEPVHRASGQLSQEGRDPAPIVCQVRFNCSETRVSRLALSIQQL